jgi:hypothetical protein
MRFVMLCLGTLAALACERPVPQYCGPEKACGPDQICILPEHECKDAEQWGELSGTQVDPPNPSPLRGRLLIAQSEATKRFHYSMSLSLRSPENPKGIEVQKIRAIHLHKAGLYVTVAPIAQEFPIPASGKATGSLTIAPDDEAVFKSGGYYVDVHTEASGDSDPEVRAQLWPLRFPMGAGARIPEKLKAVLSGFQVIDPLPANLAPHTGQVIVSLGFSMGRVNYDILLGGLSEDTIAYGVRIGCDGMQQASSGIHIHEGAIGINGGHILDVRKGALNGTFQPCDVYEPFQKNYMILLLSNLAYVNVHTMSADKGEMRGQLMLGREVGDKDPKVPVPFNVNLRPVSGTTPAATVARFILNHSQTTLTYRIDSPPGDITAMGIFYEGEASARLPLSRTTDKIPLGGMVSLSDLLNKKLNLRIETRQGSLRGDLIVPRYPG